MYLAIKNQIFNRHSWPLSVRKMSGKFFNDGHRHTPKPVVLIQTGHHATAKRGNFLSEDEVDGIEWIKTPYNDVKTEISASKSIFKIHFMQFCGPWITHKNGIPMH